MSVKIFVDTPRSVCIERGLARDKGIGGKGDEEVLALWNQWIEWDDQYFAKDNPRAVADIIVNGTDDSIENFELVLEQVKQKLIKS